MLNAEIDCLLQNVFIAKALYGETIINLFTVSPMTHITGKKRFFYISFFFLQESSKNHRTSIFIFEYISNIFLLKKVLPKEGKSITHF